MSFSGVSICVLRASSFVFSVTGSCLWSVFSTHDELTGVAALLTTPCVATPFPPQSRQEAGAVLTTYRELEVEKLMRPRSLRSKDGAGF